MAMNWLKGLVAPAAQFGAQQIAQQAQQGNPQGGPPVGGMPSPYGAQPPPEQQPMPFGLPQQPGMQGGGAPGAMEWSVGTKTQGGSGGGISTGGAQGLEPRNAQLQHDVESLALFARTLLTLLETKNVLTRAEFEETKKQLDMLDGKLDDR